MPGEYQSLTIVAGPWMRVDYDTGNGIVKVGGCGNTCNGCIALMTTRPEDYLALSYPGLDRESLDIALTKAIVRGNGDSIIISGKRDPTRHPYQVSDILDHIHSRDIDVPIELQTTGPDIIIPEYMDDGGWLDQWREKGLNTISLSIVDVDQKNNTEYFTKGRREYPDIAELTNKLHQKGFTVRWSLIQMHPYIHDSEGLERVVDAAREHDMVQLSMRPLRATSERPLHGSGMKAYDFVKEHELSDSELEAIAKHVVANTHNPFDINEYLAHDGVVYNYRSEGRKKKPQNLAMVDCVTHTPENDLKKGVFRQLIYYPNGRIQKDWTHETNFMLDMGRGAREWIAQQKAK